MEKRNATPTLDIIQKLFTRPARSPIRGSGAGVKQLLLLALAQALLLSIAACGGSSSSGGSCTFSDPAAGFTSCEDFVGSGYTSALDQTDCTKGNGTYSQGACPTAGALGTCILFGGTPEQGKVTYYAADAGTSTTVEQSACTSEGGTWTGS